MTGKDVRDMLRARLVLDNDFVVGEVDPRLFGAFVEHLGRCVYEGIYEPGHPSADEEGFRTDVLELVRELRVPVVRYPGGNFVSGYNWEDGTGPRESRPRRLDLAWRTLETNQFGINEFVAWCRKANVEPMVAVNMGTRGPEAARNLVEYCNHPGGTYWSDLRREHGYAKPHGVKLWCLGNEVDGPWQMCHRTAEDYGRVARESAKMMKWTDPSIELVACGSSSRGMPTFGAWEAEVLEHNFNDVEYISIHTYYGNPDDDTPNFLAKPEEMGQFIEEVAATCDYVAARRRSRKRIMLSFDEWNVWFLSQDSENDIPDWSVAPPLMQDAYSMQDALVVGGMLITLLNHCDRVKIACLAQLVNVIAPIMTDARRAWRQTIFYPFAHASRLGRGAVLRQAVQCPRYDAKDRRGVPYLASACVRNARERRLTVFAVNRSLTDELRVRVDLRGFPKMGMDRWTVLRHDDLKAVNTARRPDKVAPQSARRARVGERGFNAVLRPASWNVIELSECGR